MTPPTVAQLLAQAAKRLRADFEYARSSNPHSGEKGAEVESILRQFLNDHLPKRFAATSGYLLDSDNRLSAQTDVIIYDAFTSPIYRAGERTQIIPAQTAAIAIEVKTCLTKGELADAYDKIATCKRLKRPEFSSMDRSSTETGLDTTNLLGVVFAFTSVSSLATTSAWVQELNEARTSDSWPDLIVVLDKGVIDYSVNWPGSTHFGTLASIPHQESTKAAAPPFYVLLTESEDDQQALNQFYALVVSHLAFYAFRQGVGTVPHSFISTERPTRVVCGYQFDSHCNLAPVPDALTGSHVKASATFRILDANDTQIGLLEYVTCQDGGWIRKTGPVPLAGLLVLLQTGRLVQTYHDPDVPEREYSSVIKCDVHRFRAWALSIRDSSNMHIEFDT